MTEPNTSTDSNTAIVHEWFETLAGSERVVGRLLGLYPQARLLALVDFLPEADRALLGGRTVETSFLQALPGAGRNFRRFLPMMPRAMRRFDVREADLVISSSHCVAKGIRTRPGQMHLSYVHAPMRYAWDQSDFYLSEAGLDRGLRGWAARKTAERLRRWDRKVSRRVFAMAANSRSVATKIRRFYGREAEVIHPPVDVSRFDPTQKREDFYLVVSRLAPYKRVGLILEAFETLDRPLVIIGHGPGADQIAGRCERSKTIQFLGHVDDATVTDHMQRCRAMVVAAEEDFGIATAEAQAAGAPVLGFGSGGTEEIVADGCSGILFHDQTREAIQTAVEHFEQDKVAWPAERIAEAAERFDPERFDRQWLDFAERMGRRFAENPSPDQTAHRP